MAAMAVYYKPELTDNELESSSEEEICMDLYEDALKTDDSTESKSCHSVEGEWWDSQEQLEKVIAIYAYGYRCLTGPEKEALLAIRLYVQGY